METVPSTKKEFLKLQLKHYCELFCELMEYVIIVAGVRDCFLTSDRMVTRLQLLISEKILGEGTRRGPASV